MHTGHYSESTSFGPLFLVSLGLVGSSGFLSTCLAVLIRRRFGVLALWVWSLLPGLFFTAIVASEWSTFDPGLERAAVVAALLFLGIAVGLAPAVTIIYANNQPAPPPYWVQVRRGTAAVFASIIAVDLLLIAVITATRLAQR